MSPSPIRLSIITLICAFVGSSLTLPSAHADTNSNIGAGACMIRFDDRLLLVEDVWSKRWSLPGGMIERNETPEEAAVREVLEETGLEAEITTPLIDLKKTRIFECIVQNKQSLVLLDGSDNEPTVFLPPDAHHEIRKARFKDPKRIPTLKWRFPEQRMQVIELFESISPSNEIRSTPSLLPINSWVRSGLEVNRAFQLLNSNIAKPIFSFFNLFGEDELYYFLVPIFWLCFHWTVGARLTVLLLLSTLLNGALKDSLEMTRPLNWDPTLAIESANGYGLPSGHTQISMIFWGFMALVFGGPFAWIGPIIVVGTGCARIYFGAHFYYDVIAGFLLGTCVLALFVWLRDSKPMRVILESKREAWMVLAPLGAVALFQRFHPETLDIVTLGFGILIGLRFGAIEREELTRAKFKPLNGVTRVALAVVGIVAIRALGYVLAPTEGNVLPIVLVKVLIQTLLGLWVSLGVFKAAHWIEKKAWVGSKLG